MHIALTLGNIIGYALLFNFVAINYTLVGWSYTNILKHIQLELPKNLRKYTLHLKQNPDIVDFLRCLIS